MNPRMNARLSQALASVGVPNDSVDSSTTPPTFTYPTTGRRAAKPAQITKGLEVCAAFDKSDQAQAAWEDAQQPERSQLRSNLAEMIRDLNQFLAIPDPTAAQIKGAVIGLAHDMKRVLIYLAKQVQ